VNSTDGHQESTSRPCRHLKSLAKDKEEEEEATRVEGVEINPHLWDFVGNPKKNLGMRTP